MRKWVSPLYPACMRDPACPACCAESSYISSRAGASAAVSFRLMLSCTGVLLLGGPSGSLVEAAPLLCCRLGASSAAATLAFAAETPAPADGPPLAPLLWLLAAGAEPVAEGADAGAVTSSAVPALA